MQHRGFHVDREAETAPVAEGYPVESHLPAVQVAVDVNRGVGELFLLEVVARRETDFPLFGDVEVAADIQGLHDFAGMRPFRIFVGDVVERVVDGVHIVIEVVLDGIGEGVTERDGPRVAEVRPLRGHSQGVLGEDLLFLWLLLLFLILFPFEIVVVDGPVQTKVEVGVGESHQPVVLLPFGAVDAYAALVIAVRVEVDTEGDIELLEQGGTS